MVSSKGTVASRLFVIPEHATTFDDCTGDVFAVKLTTTGTKAVYDKGFMHFFGGGAKL